MTAPTDEFLGELRLGRRLATRGQVAAGGLAILTGLIFLVADPAVSLVGPRAALASVLAGVVLGLTLLSVVELLGGSGERGGTYVLIHESLGGLGAFLAGWSILAGSAGLSGALAQIAATHLLLLFPALQLPPNQIALALFGILILVELFQLLPRRPLLWPLIVALLMVLAFLILSAIPRIDVELYRSAPAVGLGDLMRSVAWLAVGYIAFEAVLASRRQVRDPGRNLPPAIVAVLIFGGLAFAVATLVAAGVSRFLPTAHNSLASALAAASFLPAWASPWLTVIAVVLAADGCLMVATRQMHALSRDGALPASLRRIRGPFPMSPLLFGALVAIAVPLIAWAPTQWLIDLAAGLFLTAMTLLNAAAIHSRRTEPERRRAFVVPFYPLAPAVAIAVDLVLLSALPLGGLVGGSVWLLVGVLVYLAYARRHQVAAQEGVVVFGREPQREKREASYRVLVPLTPGDERRLPLRLAAALAHQFDGEVIPLQVIPMSDPLAIEESRRVARERNTLFHWSTRLTENFGVPVFPITRLAHGISQGIIDTAVEEDADLILMPWAVTATTPGAEMGQVLEPVIRRALCDLAVVAYHSGDSESHRPAKSSGLPRPLAAWPLSSILVPTAGGPHAPLAMRIALALAREYDATVTMVYVAPADASSEQLAEGQERIEQTTDAMRQQAAMLPGLNGQESTLEKISVESRVVTAGSVVAGIAEAGKERDLVLIGASEESFIDQMLFGNVPEQVALACPTPVVMVKKFRGLPRFWLKRAWDALYEALPTLSGEERIEVYREVRRGARPDVDFFVMMGLSAIIATFGLLQNSTAVIIGAMLVAPLFTPILALSLAIVRGDVRLLRLAVEAALKGIALVIGLAVLLAAVSPLRTVTPEIAARSQPNLFDLAVALASGAAGAYAIARKDVAASLPGVAIAAALVPPLAVVGIGLALGDLVVAGGGGLLFTTNLTAITLAGAVTLLLLGFRPAHRGEPEVRLRVGLAATMVLLVLITLLLALLFVRSVNTSRTQHAIQLSLTREIEAMPDLELANFDFRERGAGVEVEVTVYSRATITPALAQQLSDRLSEDIRRPVQLRVVAIPITEIEATPR
ncbi:MAG: DUF389 domain-containing protein [Anaerolineae bacterium]